MLIRLINTLLEAQREEVFIEKEGLRQTKRPEMVVKAQVSLRGALAGNVIVVAVLTCSEEILGVEIAPLRSPLHVGFHIHIVRHKSEHLPISRHFQGFSYRQLIQT